MNLFSLLSLGAFVAHVLLAFYVLLLSPRSSLNRIFTVMAVTFALWSLGYTFAHQARDEATYWEGYRIAALGWGWCPSAVLHFFLRLTGQSRVLRSRLLLAALYAPGLYFTASVVSGQSVIVDQVVRSNLGWIELLTTGSFDKWAYYLYYSSFSLLGVALAVRWGLRSASSRERLQAGVIVGTGLANLLVITVTEFVLPEFGIAHLPVLSPVSLLIWTGGMAYSIVRTSFLVLTPALAADDILTTMADALVILDADARVLTLNPPAALLLGLRPAEALGKSLAEVISDAAIVRQIEASRPQGAAPLRDAEFTFAGRGGEVVHLSVSVTAIRREEPGPIGSVVVLRDVTEIKAARESLSRLAHHDFLTGLPNRLLFTDRFGQALLRAKRYGNVVAVMMLDLDGFKGVNDRFGHDAGDDLLRGVAVRLTRCVRESDTVARIGGDEFAIVLPDVRGQQGAAAVANRILEAFAEPFPAGGREIPSTISIGVGLYPEDGADTEALLRSADRAMYRVKGAGKNDFQFHSAALGSPMSGRR